MNIVNWYEKYSDYNKYHTEWSGCVIFDSQYDRRYLKHVKLKGHFESGTVHIAICKPKDHPTYNVSSKYKYRRNTRTRNQKVGKNQVITTITSDSTCIIPLNYVKDIPAVIQEGVDKYIQSCKISALETIEWI